MKRVVEVEEKSAMFMTDEEYQEAIEDKMPKPFISAVVGLILLCLVVCAAIMSGFGSDQAKPAAPVLSFVTENQTEEGSSEVLTVNDMVNEFGNLFNEAPESSDLPETEEILIGSSGSSGSSKKKVTSLNDAKVPEKEKDKDNGDKKESTPTNKSENNTTVSEVKENVTQAEPEEPENNTENVDSGNVSTPVITPTESQEEEQEKEEDKDQVDQEKKEEEKEDNGSEQDTVNETENETSDSADDEDTVEENNTQAEPEEPETPEENNTVEDDDEEEPEVTSTPETEPTTTLQEPTGSTADGLNSNATAT